jgi:hypothetical protein
MTGLVLKDYFPGRREIPTIENLKKLYATSKRNPWRLFPERCISL